MFTVFSRHFRCSVYRESAFVRVGSTSTARMMLSRCAASHPIFIRKKGNESERERRGEEPGQAGEAEVKRRVKERDWGQRDVVIERKQEEEEEIDER